MLDNFQLLNKHFKVSHVTFEKLNLYNGLLIKWQSKINLVGNDTIANSWNRHFLDSIQLTKYIDNSKKTIVDLGTGAGFPGMVLAVIGYYNINLIESDSRKVAFLKEVARITETEVFIHNCRIENNPISDVDVLLSRACAPLNRLLELSQKRISRGTTCLFHKGRNYSIENIEAQKNWNYDISVMPSIVDSESVILKLSNVRKIGYD